LVTPLLACPKEGVNGRRVKRKGTSKGDLSVEKKNERKSNNKNNKLSYNRLPNTSKFKLLMKFWFFISIMFRDTNNNRNIISNELYTTCRFSNGKC